MKRLILLLSAVTLISTHATSQILKNSGFEVWVQDTFQTSINIQGIPISLTSEYNKPEYWSTANQFTNIEDDQNFISFDKTVTKKDSNSFAGTYAAKLSTKTLSTPQGQIAVPGAISNGTLNLDLSQNPQDFSFNNILENVTGGSAVQTRPSHFKGYYKYLPAGNDSLLISVQAKSWDSSKKESEIVGVGTFFSTDSQSTYKQFSVEVSYTSCTMPDTVLVNVSAGASQQSTPGTEMFVDSVEIDTLDTQSNFPPFANNDDTSTRKGEAVTVDILNNDVDCDDPILQSTQKVSQASNGSVTINDSTATYNPDAGFSGTDQFQYSISDNQESDTATVNVAVNSAPQAQDDTVFTVANTSSIQVDVTSNDSDPEGHNLAVDSIATSPANGNASVVSDDTIEYTPNSNYTGSDQLEYVVCDVASPVLCDTGTVKFDVITGIQNDSKGSLKVTTYPNPAQDEMFIHVSTAPSPHQNFQLRIMGTTGKIQKVESIQEGKTRIDLANLSQGLYLFDITTQDGELIERGKLSVSR